MLFRAKSQSFHATATNIFTYIYVLKNHYWIQLLLGKKYQQKMFLDLSLETGDALATVARRNLDIISGGTDCKNLSLSLHRHFSPVKGA